MTNSWQAITWTNDDPSLLKHIRSTRPQCVNTLRPSDAYMRHYINHRWFRQWLVAWPAPSYYLNQCWNIVDRNIRSKLQWNLKRNPYIFIRENSFQNIVCEMAAILSGPQWVKMSGLYLRRKRVNIYSVYCYIYRARDSYCLPAKGLPDFSINKHNSDETRNESYYVLGTCIYLYVCIYVTVCIYTYLLV